MLGKGGGMQYQTQRNELIQICRLMYSKGFLTAADGNLSVRFEDGSFLVTPSGRNKGLIQAEELIHLSSEGVVLGGAGKPSSEFAMHRVFYEEQSEARAVIHCHALFSTVFACMEDGLDDCLMTESVIVLGSVPKAALAIPSTPELAEGLREFARNSQAVLLANHGLVCSGRSLEDAFNRIETVEHFARISYLVKMSRNKSPIPEETARRLEALRSQYGLKGPFTNCRSEDCREKQKDSNLESLKSEITETVFRLMR